MKQIVIAGIFFATLFFNQLTAQALKTKQAVWQQKVDHQIQATLDPVAKMLRCTQTIVYTNNSPDAISSIPMHIWPNAFSSQNTAYRREAVIKGNDKFLQARQEELGYLDSLAFVVNGTTATFTYQAADIVVVQLPATLPSGGSVTITTPFRVKIPFLFSRMGFSGSLLSITQWYPKPAVYDVNGWNTFSYLEQGEYYSEFGNYEVALTLPEDYVVGATGKLQEKKELDWMSELSDGTAIKRDNKKWKTIHYVQENVSDFAWFADPEFTLSEDDVQLANGHKVHIYAFMSPDGKGSRSNVLSAISTALTYYSNRVGFYPYDYCSAVIGELKAAGGMEYPMITICGSGDEGTVIHEVGHNWFQGMLGSQEREYPWMDESVNTFYQNQAEGKAPKELEHGDRVKPSSGMAGFRVCQDLGVFQEGNLHSEAYQGFNYGTIVYISNPLRFAYLQEYLGKIMMDSCMQEYFRLWHFKHPLPGDMQDVFEKTSGKKLGWFFDDLLGKSAPDVALKRAKFSKDKTIVKIKNKGVYSLPVKLEWQNGTKTESIWIQAADTTIEIPKSESVRLNPSGFLTERNIANNDAIAKGPFKTVGPFKFGFPDMYKRGVNKIWIFPNIFSSNNYDGYTPGIILSNITFPRRNWEWWLMPSYGVRSKIVVGMAGIQRNIFHVKGPFRLTEIKLIGRTFSLKPQPINTLNTYYHIAPQVSMFLKRKKPWVQNILVADYVMNRLQYSNFINWDYVDYENDLFMIKWLRRSYVKARHSELEVFADGGESRGSSLSLSPRPNFSFLKGNVKYRIMLPYHFFKSKGSGAMVQLYASSFLWSSGRVGRNTIFDPVISGAVGANDYGYRQLMFGRSENMNTGNFWSRQLLMGGMGVRMLPNIQANQFVTGMNFHTSIAPKVPINFFFDAVLAGHNDAIQNYWAGGINISQYNDGIPSFEINLPLFYSANFDPLMSGFQWFRAVNFKVNISLADPFNFARAVYQ